MYCDGILKIVSTIEGRDLNDVIAKADSVGVTAISFNGRVFVRGVIQDPADVYDTVARRWPPARHQWVETPFSIHDFKAKAKK